MQDATAWITQLAWNDQAVTEHCTTIACNDGYVITNVELPQLALKLGISIDAAVALGRSLPRKAMVERLSRQQISATPVLTIGEVTEHPQTIARNLIVTGHSSKGTSWPLLACPIRFSQKQFAVARAMGGIGEESGEVLSDWGVQEMPAMAQAASTRA
jgi:hypothetical protein